jgi:hypothetical protein
MCMHMYIYTHVYIYHAFCGESARDYYRTTHMLLITRQNQFLSVCVCVCVCVCLRARARVCVDEKENGSTCVCRERESTFVCV